MFSFTCRACDDVFLSRCWVAKALGQARLACASSQGQVEGVQCSTGRVLGAFPATVASLAQAFFCQQNWRPRPAHRLSDAMGSLGWAKCYWCGKWEYNMYIPDGVDNPLCEYCLDSRRGPPQPDARARLAEALGSICPGFPKKIAWQIAELTHHWHEP